MLDDHRRLRLIDFNSATIAKDLITIDDDVQPAGTLPYLSPELMCKICPKLFGSDETFKTFYADWLRREGMLLLQFQEYSPFAADIWSVTTFSFP